MRITLISPWGSPCGISVYAGDVYAELVARGHEVQVLAYEEPMPAETKIDLPVHRSWKIGQPPSWRVLSQIRDFGPDIIHVQHELGFFWPGSCWSDWLACLGSTRVPVVVTYHSLPDVPTVFTDTPVSLAIVCSPLGSEILRSRVDFPVRTIEHGVDGPIPLDRQTDPYSLVSFGFLAESKGYDRIMRAMQLLGQELPELNLTVLGSVTPRAFDQQVAYFQHLQRLTHELGLSGRVDVTFGFRTQREVEACLSRKALGVLHYDRTDRLPASADFLENSAPSAVSTLATSGGHRLSSESLRTAALATSGGWALSTSGPGMMPPVGSGLSWSPDEEQESTVAGTDLATSHSAVRGPQSRQDATSSIHTESASGPSYLPRMGAAGVRCQSAAVFRLWSSGVPCIVSQAQHFELGQPAANTLIRARDIPRLAAEIRRMFTDRAAYQEAVSRLGSCLTRTWSHVADDHEQAFEQALGTT